jgi:hypothetical protein
MTLEGVERHKNVSCKRPLRDEQMSSYLDSIFLSLKVDTVKVLQQQEKQAGVVHLLEMRVIDVGYNRLLSRYCRLRPG